MKKTQGNIAIEMAFSLPVFLFMLLAIIEINRYFWMGYLLDNQLHRAVKNEAGEPGIGVESRLKQYLNRGLFDSTKIIFNEKTVAIGQLSVAQYQVSYQTTLYFLPYRELTLTSTNWQGDHENDII